ncbi:MAG: HIT family protein [Euryarchaeota archaeon]|nr:HIT family protein [Euryarchaeota archaeon]
MSEDCVFCKIVKGELPCYKLYESELVLAFLDINPVTRGHALVVPKRHAERLSQLSGEEVKEVFSVAARVAEASLSKLNARGANFWVNQGSIAGQVVKHFHAHVVPRYSEEEIKIEVRGEKLSEEEMKSVAEKLRLEG